ncbi:M24 family metallopeptidase [Halobacteria archaeon AArc-curdl1]|uniref:M24 family metallopeptidase n=1 Tax=Natronosalvus hydrolyticus TaxID=2979988 RepID=A0AAP3E7D3_9EURY|nr:M24 family metallopeptidase [Halobacteria archaeon AArc-curdl1]
MEKLARLDAYLEAHDLASVWFARPNSFAWLAGGDNVVDREGDIGVGALGYDGEAVTLLANTIELERLREEEVPDLESAGVPIETETFPWYAQSLPEALMAVVDGEPAAADFDVPDENLERIDPSEIRQPLTETDIERYRELGRETAAAVEAVCRELQTDDTEAEVTAALTVSLAAQNIEAPVVLVGGAERAQRYRHYTPKAVEFGDYVLVSVTTQRHGLHASCTRAVAFDPPAWLEDHHVTAARVETTALAATQAARTWPAEAFAPRERKDGKRAAADGERTPDDDTERPATAGDVFGAIQGAYDRLGFDGEWEKHHQGGAAGFAGREWIATPDHEAPIVTPMAYAWNPTVAGAKSEDTVLVTEDGFEVLTTTEDAPMGEPWPTIDARAVSPEFDLELERPGILGVHDS